MWQPQRDTDGRPPDDYDHRPIRRKSGRWMVRDYTKADTGWQQEGDGEMQKYRRAIWESCLVVSEGINLLGVSTEQCWRR